MEMSDYDRQSIGIIIAGHGDWYGAYLIRLIAKADRNNLRLLARVYPEEVRAVLEFMGYRRGEVFESLTSDCICGANTEDAKHPHPCHAHYIPEVFESLTRPLAPECWPVCLSCGGHLHKEEQTDIWITVLRCANCNNRWAYRSGEIFQIKDRVNYNDPEAP